MVSWKAIEIANALPAEAMDDGRAIRIATARPKQWAARRGLPADVRGKRRRRVPPLRGVNGPA